MKKSLSLITLLCLNLGIFSFLSGAVEDIPVSHAKVVSVSNEGAEIVRDSQVLMISQGMLINEGDTLRSGPSTVSLVFKNGSVLKVDAGSLLTFEIMRQAAFPANIKGSYGLLTANPSESVTLLRLEDGDLTGNVKKLLDAAPASRFEIATKVGIAGIRGTSFRISLSRGANGAWSFQVSNLDGGVVFTPSTLLNTADAVVLVPDSETEVGEGEEIVIEGSFDDQSDVFTISAEGYQSVEISDSAAAQIRDAVDQLNTTSSTTTGDEGGNDGTAGGSDNTEGDDSGTDDDGAGVSDGSPLPSETGNESNENLNDISPS